MFLISEYARFGYRVQVHAIEHDDESCITYTATRPDRETITATIPDTARIDEGEGIELEFHHQLYANGFPYAPADQRTDPTAIAELILAALE